MATLRLLALFATLMWFPPAQLPAQSRTWSPEDRAILTDFSRITAIAVARDRVFIVTPAAVLGWDPLGRHWIGPWSPPEGVTLGDVTTAFADPLDGGLWLVRRAGWLRFDPGIQLWEEGAVPGAVLDAALDEGAPGAGLFLRTSGGWYAAQRGGISFPGAPPGRPVRAATINDAIRSNPAIQANSAALLLNSRLRAVRFTAAARAEGFSGQGWFLGTSGSGLFYLADGAGIPEAMRFGLPSEAADAVFAGNGGVWVVTERTPSADPGLAFVGAEFATFQWLQGPRATGLPFTEARSIVGRASDLWVASDGGVLRITPRSEDYVRYDEGRGLPDARVLSLAQRRGRIVAGTIHGIAQYTDSTGFVRVAPDFTDAALAVAFDGDSIWVGTQAGLMKAVPGQADLLVAEAARTSVAMQTAVLALTWRADTLVALLADRLLWRNPGSGIFTLGPLLGSSLGRLHTIVSGPAGLYVAGDRGVGIAGLGTPLRRTLSAPGDLPGQVTDIALDDRYLWVATLRGLVRLRLEAIGS